MKKLSLLLALILVIGLFTGCGGSAPTAKDYTLESGITLTAESGMTEKAQPPLHHHPAGRQLHGHLHGGK